MTRWRSGFFTLQQEDSKPLGLAPAPAATLSAGEAGTRNRWMDTWTDGWMDGWGRVILHFEVGVCSCPLYCMSALSDAWKVHNSVWAPGVVKTSKNSLKLVWCYPAPDQMSRAWNTKEAFMFLARRRGLDRAGRPLIWLCCARGGLATQTCTNLLKLPGKGNCAR